jgi:hypothetical protein
MKYKCVQQEGSPNEVLLLTADEYLAYHVFLFSANDGVSSDHVQ